MSRLSTHVNPCTGSWSCPSETGTSLDLHCIVSHSAHTTVAMAGRLTIDYATAAKYARHFMYTDGVQKLDPCRPLSRL